MNITTLSELQGFLVKLRVTMGDMPENVTLQIRLNSIDYNNLVKSASLEFMFTDHVIYHYEGQSIEIIRTQ